MDQAHHFQRSISVKMSGSRNREDYRTVVLKIHYGDTIGRLKYERVHHFNAKNTCYTDDREREQRYREREQTCWSPDESLKTLRSRVQKLFEISSTQQFQLTFTDSDNDIISLLSDDDAKDIIGGRIIDLSRNSIRRLHVKQVKSECSSTGDAPYAYGQLVTSQIIPPASIAPNILVLQLIRVLSSILDPESVKKLVQLYEIFSEDGPTPAQIPVDLVKNLLRTIAVYTSVPDDSD